MWGEGGSGGSNWRTRKGPRTRPAEMEEAPKKEKVLSGLFVIAGFRVHIPALVLGCESK